MKLFALMVWINDTPITGSVLALSNIVEPRKELSEYAVGDVVSIRLSGFGTPKGIIGRIEDERKKEELKDILRDDVAFREIVEKYSLPDPEEKIEATPSKKAKTDGQSRTQLPKKQMGNKNVEGKRKDAGTKDSKRSKAQPKINLEKAAEAQRQFELSATVPVGQETFPAASETLPVTAVPVTSVPITTVPVTSVPITTEPVTTVPITAVPVTTVPITAVPVTTVPITTVPVTNVPITPVPVTTVPVTTVPIKESVPLSNEMMPREVGSCSTSVGNALNILNHEPEFNLHSPSMEQRQIWLETQLGMAWQSIYELQRNVTWLSQQLQNQTSPAVANSRSYEAGGQNSSHCAEDNTPIEKSVSQFDFASQPGQFSEVFNNYTKDQLWSYVDLATDYAKACKLLFRKLFSEEEYRGRSLTGSAANKSTPARPAIQDQRKLKVIHELVQRKWSWVKPTMINLKISEILKPSRNSAQF